MLLAIFFFMLLCLYFFSLSQNAARFIICERKLFSRLVVGTNIYKQFL